MLTVFETIAAKEEEHTARMIEVLRRKQENDYQPGSTLRDAHTKHTALVRAEFTVKPDLPLELRVGVFVEPRVHAAWVRFSNAEGGVRPDYARDVRGCAIKLLEVPGEKLPESDEPNTQDFLFINIPTMPLGTVKLFHDAVYLTIEWSPLVFLVKMILTGRLLALWRLRAAQVKPTSPADIRYWSATPYLFGKERVAKYSLRPTSSYRSALPKSSTPHYLSGNLAAHLASADATFDFLVQLRTSAASMPVEDAAVEWREEDAPFVKVATLRIPKGQNFRTAEMAAFSEALAFSPGHALVEHRPVGGVNRARMRIYREQSQFRRQRDVRKIVV